MEARLEDRRKAMMEMPEMIRLWKQVSIQLILTVLEGVEANVMRRTERSWSWLEAMAQEVNESMSISLLSHGISSCRICFIGQSSSHTAWLRFLYGSLEGFGMGVLVCICTVQIDILAKLHKAFHVHITNQHTYWTVQRQQIPELERQPRQPGLARTLITGNKYSNN